MSTVRAETLVDLGRHEEALELLAGLGDEGLTARAHCLRTRAYLGLNKLKEAERAAAAARTADPSDEWGYRLGAIVARAQLRPKVADELAREAVRLEPHEPFTHQVSALTAIDVGDTKRALSHSEELIRLAPDDAITHVTYGRALAADERFSAAESAMRRALAIDPQDADAMSALADLVGARDPAQAHELRLSAVRSSPHESQHRRQLLRQGGVVGGGSLIAAGKLGLLSKFFAFGALRSLMATIGGAVFLAVLLASYVVVFGVTRVQRWRHGKALPPLVWEGLRADRRNADLLWLAWPAGLVLLGATLVAVFRVAAGQLPARTCAVAAAAAALLALSWRLRQGDARALRVGDVARDGVGVVRFLWQRRSARRSRRAG